MAVYKSGREFLAEINPARPWSGISSLQNCDKINFCDLSHLDSGILLWQPEQTNIPGSGWSVIFLNDWIACAPVMFRVWWTWFPWTHFKAESFEIVQKYERRKALMENFRLHAI